MESMPVWTGNEVSSDSFKGLPAMWSIEHITNPLIGIF